MTAMGCFVLWVIWVAFWLTVLLVINRRKPARSELESGPPQLTIETDYVCLINQSGCYVYAGATGTEHQIYSILRNEFTHGNRVQISRLRCRR